MVSVIWGIDGPALAEIVPPDLYVRVKHLCEFAIPYMEINVKTYRPNQGLKDITFHWDNASSHTPKLTIAKISELGMNQMPRPPCSPDNARSDFFLFGRLKHKLQGSSYGRADEFFSAVTNLIGNLEKSLLPRVFDELISCLDPVRCTEINLVINFPGAVVQKLSSESEAKPVGGREDRWSHMTHRYYVSIISLFLFSFPFYRLISSQDHEINHNFVNQLFVMITLKLNRKVESSSPQMFSSNRRKTAEPSLK
jgi:transposase